MAAEDAIPLEARPLRLFRKLGIERGPRRGADRCRLADFAATNGDRIASLILLCPTALDPRAATPMAPRLLVIAGDRGAAAEQVLTASASMG